MKLIIGIMLFLCAVTSTAQTDSIVPPQLWFKTSPTEFLIGYNGSNANIGLEIRLSDRYYLSSDIGVYYSLKTDFEEFYNHHGLRVRDEIKHYSRVKSGNWFVYNSLQIPIGQHSFDRIDTLEYYNSNNSYERFAKNYHATKTFVGLLVQHGFMRSFSNGLMLEFMIGGGIQYNHIVSNLTPDELDHRTFGDSTLPFDLSLQEGKHIVPRINAGIKVGFRIG